MFLHASNNQPTEGCVAIEAWGAMRDILRWLDPAKNPKIVIGVNKGTPTDETANTPAPPSAAARATASVIW